jgi:hypothetical protein
MAGQRKMPGGRIFRRYTMRKTRVNPVLLAVSVASLFVGAWSTKPVVAEDKRKIAIRDDCKPDADWGPGGCLLKEGDVTRAEFFLEAESPLAPRSVIGHQAWWNDPRTSRSRSVNR